MDHPDSPNTVELQHPQVCFKYCKAAEMPVVLCKKSGKLWQGQHGPTSPAPAMAMLATAGRATATGPGTAVGLPREGAPLSSKISVNFTTVYKIVPFPDT